ncbi:alpha/beta hydrolase [Saliterribacillus persicus]|uniref:Pimeloyl-ACP methyl ester carboxylesterase n=1 Tax=Saliterribacillus persicus TaxID=930114 RepID=A0A368XEH7_9BACI|nr:alpha/beta hydrolase [Saliterribacillus persicus]RCW66381.1 pimeloyl-ACP methyl ester carboxylesterase [Saliterribacillus persicus]
MNICREEVNIHYEYYKSSNTKVTETLIFIHGLGMDLHTWDYLIPLLKNKYHLLLYDFRGHGGTDRGNATLEMDILAEDFLFLIDYLEVSHFHIIAQGFGGFIAIEAAEIRSEAINSLTLIAVPIHYPKQLGQKITETRKQLIKQDESMKSVGEILIPHILLDDDETKREVLLNGYKKVHPDIYFELFHTGFGDKAISQLRNLEVPVLIMSGSEDKVYPPELSSATLNFISDAKCLIVPYASFLIQLDQPQITADWLERFIQQRHGAAELTQLFDNEYKKHLTTEMYAEIREIFNKDNKAKVNKDILRVDIMDGFKVHLNDTPILTGWSKRKAKALLVYLVIQRSVTRDELCEVFWPDVKLQNAKNQLRVSLHHLKQLLEAHIQDKEESILITDREHVMLLAEVESDLLIYLKWINEAEQIENAQDKIAQYTAILTRRSSNILPGLYEDFFQNYRRKIEHLWAEIALYLAEWYEDKHDYKRAFFYLEIRQNYVFDQSGLQERLEKLKESEYL